MLFSDRCALPARKKYPPPMKRRFMVSHSACPLGELKPRAAARRRACMEFFAKSTAMRLYSQKTSGHVRLFCLLKSPCASFRHGRGRHQRQPNLGQQGVACLPHAPHRERRVCPLAADAVMHWSWVERVANDRPDTSGVNCSLHPTRRKKRPSRGALNQVKSRPGLRSTAGAMGSRDT